MIKINHWGLFTSFLIKTVFASTEMQDIHKANDALPSELSTCLSCKNKFSNIYWKDREFIHCARCQKGIIEKLKTEVQVKYKKETKALQQEPVIALIAFPKIEAWTKDYYSKFSEILLSFFSNKKGYNLMFFYVKNSFDTLFEKIGIDVLYNFDIAQDFKLDIVTKQLTAACNNYIFAIQHLLGDEDILAKLLAQASVFVARLVYSYF